MMKELDIFQFLNKYIKLAALGECKPSLECRYLCLAALATIFKKSMVIESHISSIKTRKIICAGASNAGAWQGLRSTDDLKL